MTTLQQKTTRTIKIEFANEPVTSFGGLILAERAAKQLRLWSTLEGLLPARKGKYSWVDIAKSVTMGLLSGAQGTFAAQSLREDEALLRMLELEAAPEEATAWRITNELGRFQAEGLLPKAQAILARRTLDKMNRSDLLLEGFVPVFADGSLLEGSARREQIYCRKGQRTDFGVKPGVSESLRRVLAKHTTLLSKIVHIFFQENAN